MPLSCQGSPRSPTGSGSPGTPGSTSTSPSSAASAGSWSSTRYASGAPLRGRPRRTCAASTPARWSAWSTPTRTSTTPSATRSFRDGSAPVRSTPTRRRPRRLAVGGRADQERVRRRRRRPARATRSSRPDRAADHTFSSVRSIDLGDRVVELVHPGRGHTGGDLVVRVPDADVLLAGDLVEESAPPSYGPDCFPLDWPPPSTSWSGCSPRPRWWCRATAPRSTSDFVAGAAHRHRHGRRDDLRPRRPRVPLDEALRAGVALPARAARARRPPWLRARPPQPRGSPWSDPGCR